MHLANIDHDQNIQIIKQFTPNNFGLWFPHIDQNGSPMILI
jgi:hypothetical protein